MNTSSRFFCIYVFLSFFQFLFASILSLNSLHKAVGFTCLFLSVYFVRQVKLNRGFFVWLASFLFINIVSFYNLSFETWLSGYNRTILYLLFKIPEIILVSVFVSSQSLNSLNLIFCKIRSIFVLTSAVLFLYFILVYFNILPYIHRFIVFNGDRFGGFVGEPRDYGLLSFVFLLSTFFLPFKKNVFERIALSFFVIASASNAVVILFLGVVWYYFFLRKPMHTSIIIVAFITFSYGFLLNLDLAIGRFDLDMVELSSIATSFDPANPPPALNPITVRFFNFIFNLHWMSSEWLSYGVGSAMDIAHNNNLFDYNVYESSTGLFGFTMIGVELGIFGLIFVVTSVIYYLLRVRCDKDKSVLSFSIIMVMFFLSSPYSSIYFFFLLYIYKWVKISRINQA
ncbi:hypothetical protein VCSRO92_2582 [Vibrio cholerae]|nr:putative O-antigen polymerase [Vibrio cholerae]GIB45632.1 hypothetical protein VCSRO92_2582 [Vibrio cholerae]